MLGRFIDHDGGEQNAPAARFGNISLMPSPILQPTQSMSESYCLDMHSRTGFSGSPAFVFRTPGNNLATHAGIDMRDRFLYLLGIRWGQFPEPWEIAEAPTAKRAKGESLVVEGGYVKGLSGMSCVIPTWHIVDLLNLPKFKELRRQQDERWKERLAKETSPSGS